MRWRRVGSAGGPRGRWRRAGLTSLAALALLGIGLGGRPAPAQGLPEAEAERQLIALTNLSRTSNGLPALAPNPAVGAIARERSADMARRGYFSHEIPPDGRTFLDLLNRVGILFRLAGENLEHNNAADYETVQFANREFLNSPEHRRIALSPRYREIGTGVARVGDRRIYTAIFLDPVEGGAGPLVEGPAPTPFAVEPPRAGTPFPVDSPRAGTPAAAEPPRTDPRPAPSPAAAPARPRGRALRPDPGRQPGIVEAIVQAVFRQELGF